MNAGMRSMAKLARFDKYEDGEDFRWHDVDMRWNGTKYRFQMMVTEGADVHLNHVYSDNGHDEWVMVPWLLNRAKNDSGLMAGLLSAVETLENIRRLEENASIRDESGQGEDGSSLE
jgi:hypothetical protein